MEFNEFITREKPLGMREKMNPLEKQILQLDAMGYAHFQIRSWLDSNCIHVCSEALKEFIDSRKNRSNASNKNTNAQ